MEKKDEKRIYLYMIPVRGSLPPPPPPNMVWSQNLRFAAFRMKTLYLQCFLHGGLLVRPATLQILWIFATNLPKTCYLQCFGFDIVESCRRAPFHFCVKLSYNSKSSTNGFQPWYRSDICLYLMPVELSLRVSSFP